MIFIYYTGFGTDVSIYYTQFSQNSCLSLHRLENFCFSDFYTSCEAPEKSGIIQIGTFGTPENDFGASVTRKSSLWLIFPTENEQFLAGSKILDMTASELPHDADLEI